MYRMGVLEIRDGSRALRFERRLTHPVEKVWRAVTEPAQLARWFPAEVRMEPAVGGVVRWSFAGANLDLPAGTVTAYDPPRLLEYSFDAAMFSGPGATPGKASLRFELRPDPIGCLLVFTNAFEDGYSAPSFATGWTICLDALERVALDGTPAEATPQDWPDLHEEYLERFGLAEGTLQQAADGWTIRFERQLIRPPEEVWHLLTESDGSTAGPSTDIGADPPLRFTNGFVPAGAVTSVDPGRMLEYRWQVNCRPAGLVRWQLSTGPGGARLVLTQTVPTSLESHRATALAAWHIHLELLAEHLRGQTPCWPEGRTEELTRHYEKTIR